MGARTVGKYALALDPQYGEGRVPVLDGGGRLLRAVRVYRRYSELRAEREAAGPDERASAPDSGSADVSSSAGSMMTYWDARTVLAGLGLPFNEAVVVRSADEAVASAEAMGYPVTLKVSSDRIVHKAKAGGATTFLLNGSDVAREADRLMAMFEGPPGAGEGVVVEQFVAARFEAFVGARRDPEFGVMVLWGLGGGYAEEFRDIACLPWPAPPSRLNRFLGQTHFGRVLAEAQPDTIPRIRELILALGDAIAAHVDWVSVDLNPLLITAHGECYFVDARIERRS